MPRVLLTALCCGSSAEGVVFYVAVTAGLWLSDVGRMNVEKATRGLEAALAKQGTRARAEGAQRYLKSTLRFLGATVPAVRREAKAFVRAHPELDRKLLRSLAERLWRTEVNELRSLAIGIVELRVQALQASDVSWLIALVRGADTWAHVDWLATKVLGALVAREPKLEAKVVRWARDDNFWVRRTALLSLHDELSAGRGNFELFARLAVPMLGEREFFIRKAIGWVLRAVVRKRPALTVGFVERHAREMSGLTFREAVRRLPAGDQRRLLRRRERSANSA
jgi:3-methyladenine DNA glycosylase AlkD